jgi:ATP-binding protein involved in chromosome partitioning
VSSEQALAIIEPAATRVRDPKTGRSIWLAGMIKEADLEEDTLRFSLRFDPSHSAEEQEKIERAMVERLVTSGWKGEIECRKKTVLHSDGKKKEGRKEHVRGMSGPGMQAHGGPVQKQPLPGIKNIVAVASGKGGVGKSTIACNLAVALRRSGLEVGLMDADVHGPSLPTMMRVQGTPVANGEQKIIPLTAYGVKCMSMGFMVKDDEPIIWRGPMVMGVVRQFLQNVAWGELDVLIIDLPPGTGDAQLTMIQAVELAGAVIVTTPQKVAVLDAVRGVEMFLKLNVPILGIVENMSYLELPNGDKLHPFGQGGGEDTADRYDITLLEQIPLMESIRLGGDLGMPSALSSDPVSGHFLRLAEQVSRSLDNG